MNNNDISTDGEMKLFMIFALIIHGFTLLSCAEGWTSYGNKINYYQESYDNYDARNRNFQTYQEWARPSYRNCIDYCLQSNEASYGPIPWKPATVPITRANNGYHYPKPVVPFTVEPPTVFPEADGGGSYFQGPSYGISIIPQKLPPAYKR